MNKSIFSEILNRLPWLFLDGPAGGGGSAPATDAPPADTGGGDVGEPSQPSEEGILDSFVEGEDTPPAPDDTQGEPQSAEGEETQDGQPQPAAPQPTPQEAAADKTLKAVYRENMGQVKEFIKAHPELRPAFFKGAELSEIFTTIEDGKQAKDWAGQLYAFDNLFYSKNPKDTEAFIQSLYENSVEPDGSSPAFDRLASSMFGSGLSNLAERIQSGDANISRAFADLGLNGKQAMVAVQAVATMLGIPVQGLRFSKGVSAPATSGNAPSMSEREQYLANEVARLNQELEDGKSSTLAQQETNFYNGIQTEFSSKLVNSIEKSLETASGLKTQKQGFQTWVKDTVRQRVINAVRQDQFFANQMEAMSRSGDRGLEHQQQLVAALEQRARQFLPDILSEVLGEAGIAIAKNNAGKANAGSPHREPVTGGTPGRLSKPGSRPTSKPQQGESYDQFARRTLPGLED